LFYQGNLHALCSKPLSRVLEHPSFKWQLAMPDSPISPGYIGTWVIESDSLYLKDIDGERAGANGPETVRLTDLFPGYADGVFAHWYSGELRCPYGELMRSVHSVLDNVHEHDLFLLVRRGVLVSERRVCNYSSIDLSDPDAAWESIRRTMPWLSKWTD
jgi:hypothetical protein